MDPAETPELEDFDTICNGVTDVGQFQTFSGISVTHVHAFSDTLNWMNSISIFPRIYEVRNRAMVNEPLNPGSFTSMFMGTYADMPFRINFSQGLWLPEVSLTVPFNKTRMDLSGSINDSFSPTIKADICHLTKKAALSGSLMTFDRFSRGRIEVSAASKFKDMKYGAYMALNLEDRQWATRFCFDKEKNGFAVGCYLGITAEGISSVARVKKTIGTTTASASVQVIPKSLNSEFCAAIERNFTMSTILGAITSSGAVKSCYVRNIDRTKRITLTSESDINQGTHSFGISVTLQ